MSDLQKKIDQAKDEFAEEQIAKTVAHYDQVRRENAIAAAGGINAINGLTNALSAQVMRALETFQQEKLHEQLGYQRFADFLDNYPYSPMTKHQYYERLKLLESEGDVVFDVLNSLNMPMRTRKLLGRGNIQLEGDTLIVTDGDEETEIELNDRTRLLETLTALADRSYLQQRKIDRQGEDLQRLVDKTERLNSENERILAMKKTDLEDLHAVALLQLSTAFVALSEEAEKLTPAEKIAFAPTTFELIAEWRERLSETYGRKAPLERPPAQPDDDDIAKVIRDLNDDELEELVGGP
ncbi:MAG TPA: hypothetical protein VMM38_01485 [Aridibacter sp.]|nr:hypothetical protein [Aridibacter sp.]